VPEIYCHCFRYKVLTGKPSHFNLGLSALSVELTENACIFSNTAGKLNTQGGVENWDLNLSLSFNI